MSVHHQLTHPRRGAETRNHGKGTGSTPSPSILPIAEGCYCCMSPLPSPRIGSVSSRFWSIVRDLLLVWVLVVFITSALYQQAGTTLSEWFGLEKTERKPHDGRSSWISSTNWWSMSIVSATTQVRKASAVESSNIVVDNRGIMQWDANQGYLRNNSNSKTLNLVDHVNVHTEQEIKQAEASITSSSSSPVQQQAVIDWSLPSARLNQLERQDVDASAISMTEMFQDIPFYGYASQEELEARSQRFPSAEQRLKTYMNGWYVPPCKGYEIEYDWKNGTIAPYVIVRESPVAMETLVANRDNLRTYYIHGYLIDPLKPAANAFNVMIYLRLEQLLKCRDRANQCESDIHTVLPALQRVALEEKHSRDLALVEDPTSQAFVPLLMQYGDFDILNAYNVLSRAIDSDPHLPVIKKFRYSYDPAELEAMTSSITCNDGIHMPCCYAKDQAGNAGKLDPFQPILWKKKVKRHYGMIPRIPFFDRPWHRKRNMALFRGALTGRQDAENDNNSAPRRHKLSDYEKCMRISRCQLVYHHVNSTLVDARFTDLMDDGFLNHSIAGRSIYTPQRMGFREMLVYKAIIMPQGNDVSTGLKWAMFSNSVVMFPKPTKTSWAMEELMQPWVHYIPLADDYSDVEEKMQWVLDHDEEAQQIAHASSLWIRDLIIHPDADKEEQYLYDETIRRYRQHFRRVSIDDASFDAEHYTGEPKYTK